MCVCVCVRYKSTVCVSRRWQCWCNPRCRHYITSSLICSTSAWCCALCLWMYACQICSFTIEAAIIDGSTTATWRAAQVFIWYVVLLILHSWLCLPRQCNTRSSTIAEGALTFRRAKCPLCLLCDPEQIKRCLHGTQYSNPYRYAHVNNLETCMRYMCPALNLFKLGDLYAGHVSSWIFISCQSYLPGSFYTCGISVIFPIISSSSALL